MKAIMVFWACILPLVILMGLAQDAGAQGLQEANFCAPGTTRPCPDIGICQDRMKTCEAGKWSSECTGGTGPQSQEICDNGLDDDCNGIADECVSLSGSIGIFLIIGGIVMLAFALVLSKVMK